MTRPPSLLRAPAGTEHRRRARPWLTAELGVVLVVVAASRLLWSMRSFDVFVDEVTYLRLSQAVAETGLPVLYGEPFYLHPPGGLLVQAVVAAVVGWPDGVFAAVQQQRVVVALCAAVTAVGLRVLGGRLGGAAAGRTAVVLVLLDPVMLRLTSRNLLEGPMVMWLVLGLLLLLPGAGRPSRPAAVLGGVLLGMSVLTKDTALLVTALPLVVAAALRWVDRARAALALVALVATYSLYPLWVAAHGQLGELLDQKLVGVARLTGHVQMTGFNAHGSTSFVDQVLQRAVQLGPSYALLAAGGASALVLVVLGRQTGQRVVGLWAASAVALSAWTVFRGTLEEQLFYLLLVPSSLAVPLAVGVLAARGWLPGPRRTAAGVVALLWVVASVTSYADVRTTRDDNFLRMTDYVASAVEGTPTTVAVMADPGDVLLRDVRIVMARTEAELLASGADLLLVSSRSLEDGTVPADEGLLRLIDSLPVVHEVEGPSVGRLVLLRLDAG